MIKRKVLNWGSVLEAAERRGVSAHTMRRFITRGLVYAERVGPKLIRVDLDSRRSNGYPHAVLGR
jgi:hypothetical protein